MNNTDFELKIVSHMLRHDATMLREEAEKARKSHDTWNTELTGTMEAVAKGLIGCADRLDRARATLETEAVTP